MEKRLRHSWTHCVSSTGTFWRSARRLLDVNILILPYSFEQATEQLTSNEKHDGKFNFEAAPDSQPYGEMNAGKWFKRVARPMVRHPADIQPIFI